MEVTRSDGDDVRPCGGVALAVRVSAHRHDGTVCAETNGVVITRSDGVLNSHALPKLHAARTGVFIIAEFSECNGSECCFAIFFQRHGGVVLALHDSSVDLRLTVFIAVQGFKGSDGSFIVAVFH